MCTFTVAHQFLKSNRLVHLPLDEVSGVGLRPQGFGLRVERFGGYWAQGLQALDFDARITQQE